MTPPQNPQQTPTKAIKITCSSNNLFATWLTLTYMLHHLTDKEIAVAAAFLAKYAELKKSIINDDTLNKVTFSKESRREIRESLGLSTTYFQVIMKGLRDKHFYSGTQINKQLIPEFSVNGSINLLYLIKIDDKS
jgi:glutamate/tyrosine decarboxylase-like PLP-dependent enzyme